MEEQILELKAQLSELKTQMGEIKLLIQEHNLLQKKVYNSDEAARYMGISKAQLYKLTSQKEIEFFRPTDKKLAFTQAACDAYLLRNPVKTAEQEREKVQEYLSRKRSPKPQAAAV
jgi:excisionase family DNA binding protein